jgi:hypothetical protein
MLLGILKPSLGFVADVLRIYPTMTPKLLYITTTGFVQSQAAVCRKRWFSSGKNVPLCDTDISDRRDLYSCLGN